MHVQGTQQQHERSLLLALPWAIRNDVSLSCQAKNYNHWKKKTLTVAAWQCTTKTRLSCTTPAHTHTHVNIHIHAFHITFRNANSFRRRITPSNSCVLYTNTSPAAAARDQTSLWSGGGAPPWRSLTGGFPSTQLQQWTSTVASHDGWARWSDCVYNRGQSGTAVTKKLYQQLRDRSSLCCLAL